MGQITTSTTPYVTTATPTPLSESGVIQTSTGTEITPADIDEAMATLERLKNLNASAPLSAPDQADREQLQSLYAALSDVPPNQLTLDAQDFMYSLSQYEGFRSATTGEPLPDMFQVQDLNSGVLKSMFDELNKSPDISYDDMIALYLKFEDELQQSQRLLKTSKHQQRMNDLAQQKSKIEESGQAEAASMRSSAIAGMAAGGAQFTMAVGALKAASSEIDATCEMNAISEDAGNYVLDPSRGGGGGMVLNAESQADFNAWAVIGKNMKASADHRSMQGQAWSSIGQSSGQIAGASQKEKATMAQGDEKAESAKATAHEFESGQASEMSQKAGERRDRVLQSFADAERARGEMLQKAANVA